TGPPRSFLAGAGGEERDGGREGRGGEAHGPIQAGSVGSMSDLERLDEQTDLLLRTARAIEDLEAPSLCEGWTRGHVVSHLARNADGLARAAAGVLDGSRASMYDSQEARDADIDAGAGRAHDDAVADLVSSAVA